MSTPASDKNFAGAIPEIYETHLVPLIFTPYAADIARRLSTRPVKRVLEIAAGTGVVTRALANALPPEATIVATDLNQAMLDQAAVVGISRPVEWRQADAMALPFEDGSFDVVVCQFGVMFFPDKPKAFAEARRVLAPGGLLLFNVWDRIEENEFAAATMTALGEIFPNDPPKFMVRTPHGYCDPAAIRADLEAGGFTRAPRIETLPARAWAASARIPAFAICQGTPMRTEIESRGAPGLRKVTARVEEALTQKFGAGAVDGKIQALVVTVER